MFTRKLEDLWDSIVFKFERIHNYILKKKRYRKNKKAFKLMLETHTGWDYDSFFEFMEVFLTDQINLSPSYSVNRENLVKRLIVIREYARRIRDDDYVSNKLDFVGAPMNVDILPTRPFPTNVTKILSDNIRQEELDEFSRLLSKYLLHSWD